MLIDVILTNENQANFDYYEIMDDMNLNNENNRTNLGNPDLITFDKGRFSSVKKSKKLPGQIKFSKQRTIEFMRRMDKIFDRDKEDR